MDGVLKSWAVTKGPSLTVGEKRLAVRTEDHPIEYFDFEGNIPKGEYGAGSMIDWDRGRWEPESDPQKGLAKGHLAFTLDGTRLKGRWHLVWTRPRSGDKTEPWLLIKSAMNSAGIETIGKSPTRRQHHISAAERTKSSRSQVRYAKITRPESGWRASSKSTLGDQPSITWSSQIV
jgi:DNA ligase D-like protein (predicted 3'-phosphoesterase)